MLLLTAEGWQLQMLFHHIQDSPFSIPRSSSNSLSRQQCSHQTSLHQEKSSENTDQSYISGGVNRIAAAQLFELKMGCGLHKMGVALTKWVWLKCVPKIHFMKLVTMSIAVALKFTVHVRYKSK